MWSNGSLRIVTPSSFALVKSLCIASIRCQSSSTSLSEYRQRLRDHHAQFQKTGRPLYVTTNGEAAAVVLSPQAYDALADKAELAESLR